MARCEDCIHEKLCVIKAFPDAFENTQWEKEHCDNFHYKDADVVPNSQVAREIFAAVELKMFCNQYEHIPFGSSDRVEYYGIELKDAIAELKKKYTEKLNGR